MLRQTSVLALLAAAVVGLTPVVQMTGCYPHDYDPLAPGINPPSKAQIDQAAKSAGETAFTVTSGAGFPLLAPVLDLAARLIVLAGAWWIARTYPKQAKVTPAKE